MEGSLITASAGSIGAPVVPRAIHTNQRPWLRRYSFFVCFFALCVVLKGALVSSHGAGLAVPDWPTTFGENMFLFPYSRWVGGIFYEHGHRLLAATVGSLTLGLACWLALREERAWVRGLGYTAVGLVMLQGGLGGLTVLLGLSIIVSSLHAVIAQTFFLLLLTIAYSLSVEYRQSNAPAHRWTRAAALLAMAVLYLQLAVGAVMRHSGAGMAIPDLPTAGGAWIPQFDEAMIANVNLLRDGLGLRHVGLYEIALHFAHRVGALLVVASQGFLVVTALRAGGVLKRSAWLNLNLLILQFSLGLFTVLSAKEPFVTSLHVLGGALLLGATWLLVLRSSARTAPGVDAGTG